MNPEQITPQFIEFAYRNACFPMAESRRSRRVAWYEPDPRTIIPLDSFHIPTRLTRTVRQGRFDIRFNTSFICVIAACAERPETWINDPIIAAYGALHRLGRAHSVEAWREDRLVGGLYGVSLGAAFMGESMFSIERDASKVCLVRLVDRLRERGYELLDVQLPNPHLEQFGAKNIPAAQYRSLLERALAKERAFA
jgi:leucyl/phenylalanyl-tRNA---protein transferase